MGIPTIFVILGATGDLVARKIIPALFHLFENDKLPRHFIVIGFAMDKIRDDYFQKHIGKALIKHGEKYNKEKLKEFLTLFTYQQGLLQNFNDYKKIFEKVQKIDEKWKVCSNKIFYLATPPEFYEIILRNLAASKLTKACSPEEGFTRLLIEKPLGKNLKEAIKIDNLLGKLFKEAQIYRIDHYLTKEAMQNIMAFRFANNFLESCWNNKLIGKIEVKLLEKIDVEGRGNFYDTVGALFDVGQNHLLEMLALTTMDNPSEFSPGAIRSKRAELLKQLKVMRKDEIKKNTVRGQYKGYVNEKGVNPKSNIETYFKIKTYLNLPRWQGVPIFLESGKKLPEVYKAIIFTFRHSIPCLCPEGVKEHYKDALIFRIEPKPGISIRFWAKKPGQKYELEEQSFDFNFKTSKTRRYIEEYEKLILDAIDGDQTFFPTSEEAMAGWRFIAPISKLWRKNIVKLHIYNKDYGVFEIAKRIEQEFSLTEIKKEIGIIGLGKMGKNITLKLLDKGWHIIGYNRSPDPTKELEKFSNFSGVYSLKEMVNKLSKPRVIWQMIPHDKIDDVLFSNGGLADLLDKGDIIIDGGNSFYLDSIRRAKTLAKKKIEFIDVGISGGPEGARYGAALMIGGKEKNFKQLEVLFSNLARSYAFFKGNGAGHFVKMVHNGIEYGMMQSIAEGFTILKKSPFNIDLIKASEVYNNGSVIESRLIGWLGKAFNEFGADLKLVSGTVTHTGEAEWTIRTADKLNVKAKTIKHAFEFRKQSVKTPSYIGKILTALRNQFGGHPIRRMSK